MKPKFDVVKVVSIVGTVLSIGGSLISTWAGNKQTKKIIGDLVKEELAKK